MAFLISFLFGFVALLLFYLSLPGQRWLAKSLPKASYGFGLALLIIAGWVIAQEMSSLSAVLTIATLVMLILPAFPYLSLMRRDIRK